MAAVTISKVVDICHVEKVNQAREKITAKQYAVAIMGVAMTTYRAAPLAIIAQVFGSIVTAALPIFDDVFRGSYHDGARRSLRWQ